MYSGNSTRNFFGITALATVLAGAQGCVADRPSRNGVFDENQYVRKDFLVQPDANGIDQGWFMKATIRASVGAESAREPRPLHGGGEPGALRQVRDHV